MNTRSQQCGFSMIEALVAILVFSLGLLGLVAFQAVSVKAQDDAKKRADAAFIANQIVGDMWGVPPADLASCAGSFSKGSTGCNNSPWGDRVDQGLPGGSAEVAIIGNDVTITLKWFTPGHEEEHRYVHTANVSHNI